eukprot:CAMPEP_0181294752 /NCGR_PEP_ID=MMETSP1101-20121128/3775_1 /TAXON_ID=46948 /ORGANISM="Rhodomonas abbreviata, Strain Caron Lab Isolate" /LENGTH=237 /DNA_ID=CAMNT_0023399445 /DNA_START=304 /DNA_END=1017 /DNA_ORIENTATION=+
MNSDGLMAFDSMKLRGGGGPPPSLADPIKAVAVFSMLKLPWYLGIFKTPDHGLETGVSLSFTGMRGFQLTSHPQFFLAPHVMAGSWLLWQYANRLQKGLIGTCDRSTFVWFAAATLFGLHVLPERAGVPNRQIPGTNQFAVFLLWAGSATGFYGLAKGASSLVSFGTHLTFAPLFLAPAMDLVSALGFTIARIFTGKWPVPDPEKMPRNPDGYSGKFCPFAALDAALTRWWNHHNAR